MRATEIIRNILDIIDQVEDSESQPQMSASVQIVRPDSEQEYNNEPNEKIVPIGTILGGGTDVNRPKNPADIRTNAPSMFPGFQAGMRYWPQ